MTTGKKSLNRKMARAKFYFFCRNISIFILLVFAFGIGVSASVWLSVKNTLPEESRLSDINPPSPTRVFAADGSFLGRVYKENREVIKLSDMGRVADATLAVEDIRFYSHGGFDTIGILRAMTKNISTMSAKEGASTITQQLARNLYLTNEKVLTRKLQEIAIALELEKRYSKEEILETYLNQIYYGSNPNRIRSYGVKTAAQTYFGVSPDKLTLSQAALIAGIPKNPYGYDPYKHPEQSKRRRDTVLVTMYKNGFISQGECTAAVNEPLGVMNPPLKSDSTLNSPAPYYMDYVLLKEVSDLFGKEQADTLIYEIGVDIYTTLDPRLQKTADDVVRKRIAANRGRRITEGALVTIDAKTGAIKAMVGGIDYKSNQYNVVTQGKRQPGSSFKPIIYTTALLRGYTDRTIVEDTPLKIGNWSPKNSGSYSGFITLSSAIQNSKNVVAVRVAQDIGMEDVVIVAKAMGIESTINPYLSSALGASEVTPLELCGAYTVLANNGVRNEVYSIAAIAKGDRIIYEQKKTPERVIPISVAEMMTKMLTNAVNRGTGTGARSSFSVAGKTGTTNSHRDAWFVGYTKDLVTAVWVGNRDNTRMAGTFGGTVPAPIWREYMAVAQPIVAAEHKRDEDQLKRLNDVKDGTKLNRTPSRYISGKGARRQGSKKDNSTYENEGATKKPSAGGGGGGKAPEVTPNVITGLVEGIRKKNE